MYEKILEINTGEVSILENYEEFFKENALGISFKEFLTKVSSEGRFGKADLTVGDIYGKTCDFLPVDLLASSLGKIDKDANDFDKFKSFLFLLYSNIGFTLRQMVDSLTYQSAVVYFDVLDDDASKNVVDFLFKQKHKGDTSSLQLFFFDDFKKDAIEYLKTQ